MRQLPVKTKLSEVDVARVANEPVFRTYRQVLLVFDREPAAHLLKDFFAEPNVSGVEQLIYWHTRANGEIRVWSQLNDQQKLWATEQIRQVCDRIRAICDALVKIQGANSSIIATLQSMLMTPGIEASLCVVGSQPVLAQWGCRPFGCPPSDFNLQVQGTKTYSSLREPEIASLTESEFVDGTKTASGQDVDLGQISSVAEETKKEPNDDETTKREMPIVDEPIEPVAPSLPLRTRKFYWRWLLLLFFLLLLAIGLFFKKWTYLAAGDSASLDRHRAEIADLWLKIDEKSKTCKPVVPPKVESDPPATQLLDPEAFTRKDLNVFNGNWQMITDLRDAENKENIRIQLLFDGSGKGISTTRSEGGDVCTGSTTVAINSKNSFSVNMSAQSCQRSRGYVANFAECIVREDNKTADCVLQCAEGPCKAVFQRN